MARIKSLLAQLYPSCGRRRDGEPSSVMVQYAMLAKGIRENMTLQGCIMLP